jgi:hypothetical protein
MTPSEIVENAKKTGTLWLGGEMEIPYPCRFYEAYQRMNDIAEGCGSSLGLALARASPGERRRDSSPGERA